MTGASRGIGRAIAERLAGQGVSIVINHRASEAHRWITGQSISASGGLEQKRSGLLDGSSARWRGLFRPAVLHFTAISLSSGGIPMKMRITPEMRRFWLVAGIVFLSVLVASAQDPVKVDPKHHKVEFENAQVRVLRINIGPHEKTAPHEHPSSVVVFLTDSNNKVTPEGGKPRENKEKRGSVTWLAGEKHIVENMGAQPFEAILVELKGKPAAKSAKAKPPVKKRGS